MENFDEIFHLSLKNCHLKSLKNLPNFFLLNNLNIS